MKKLFPITLVFLAVSIFGALGQTFPSRPVTFVVALPAGGAVDALMRVLADHMKSTLGQPIIIENIGGAGGTISIARIVRSAPDGYTLLLAASPNAINASLYDKLNFNFIRDIAPVASIMRVANVMVVHPSVPATTVSEFITHAKANAGKISMASAGNGSTSHISGELFKMMTAVNIVHVPYRGNGPALTDLLGGQVQVMFPSVTSSIEYIRSGKVRALGVTTAIRSEALPDIPTVAEFLPGYESSFWYGIGAPKATPVDIIDKLNKEISAGLADPKIEARLANLGGDVLALSPADFGRLIADETEKWAKVIKFVGIKAE
jgi:tripartite-type tricarboxylate transporter receptor subunit TctC